MKIQKQLQNRQQGEILKLFTCKDISIENGQFLYNSKRVVNAIKHRQLELIKDFHEYIVQSTHSKATAFHKGRIPISNGLLINKNSFLIPWTNLKSLVK